MENLLGLHGIWSEYNSVIPGMIVAILFLGYIAAPLIAWGLVLLPVAFLFGCSIPVLSVLTLILLVFLIPPVRRILVSSFVMKALAPIMPKISDTEKTALDAGVVWVEADLFSGRPDFNKILQEPYPMLTKEEQDFVNGPVQELCALIDSWKIWKNREFDEKIWNFIKKEKFLGMIIPKEYGGLGFSNLAHSEVIMILASRSIPVCVTIMVPNSLGPAELLIHYGTEEQRKKYLPRLAVGQEMPCFGLTEPNAGSDAGSITSSGELFKGEDGKIYIKLNWNKRWITLAAVSTVIGLAFRLRDPKNLLGKGEDLGITCALIPSSTAGVVIGNRHDPLNVPFFNCPTQGKDVIVNAEDSIIGGLANAGKGWSLLMECLAAGRGISLPAQSAGGAKLIARVTSAHSVIRQQFGVSIGTFEGIEEPLARIAGNTYALEAMRKFTIGALDKGIKPPVITAIMKYFATEMGRNVIVDGMDIMGGAAISMGPRNLLAEIYIATPIGITVEGANILTRTLIIFGQGALRAHPYAYREVKSIEAKDLVGFDSAFWGHIGHIVSNTCRAIVLSATRGYVIFGQGPSELRSYTRRLSWISASFAILSDVAMGTLGGNLKFREKVTGRFADILAWMYISTAIIRRYEADGRKSEDLATVKYMLKHALAKIQTAFDGILDNMYGVEQKSLGGKLTYFILGTVFKTIVGAWSRLNSVGSEASDHLQHVICKNLLAGGEYRSRLTEGIYIPKAPDQQLARLENALGLVLKSAEIEKKVYAARKSGALPRIKGAALLQAAKDKSVITNDEYAILQKAVEARWDAIQVDDFTESKYKSLDSALM